MAEHLNGSAEDFSADPMQYMGQPLSVECRMEGYKHALDMGLSSVEAHAVTERVANALERDDPYRAQQEATRIGGLMAYYRITAALLAARCEEVRLSAERVERATLRQLG